MKEKSSVFKEDYNAIYVAKRITFFGISIWYTCHSIYKQFGDESLALYHRTRDHYLNQWGRGNVRLTLVYPKWTQVHQMKPLRQCINASGVPKKTFKVFEDAVDWAHKMNKNPRTIWAQQAYKCRNCLRFHVGRNPHKILLRHKENLYDEKKKIKVSKGPCQYCGHDELFDNICFLCGKLTFEREIKKKKK